MRILVTGANGHLGTNLVADLLGAGHTVRGSVRGSTVAARTDHLRALGPVELVEGDLDRPDSLAAAMSGQDAVVHAAAVYALYAPGRDDEIIRASVNGAEVALRAAHKAGIKRVVLTSSVVTLPMSAPGGSPVTENEWTADTRVPYVRAKTEGEKRAWQLASELDLDFATVLPGACGGPGFQRNTPTIDFIETIMKGSLQFGAPPFNYPYVDVRDVARAHRLIIESGAKGRFVAINDRQPSVTEIAQTMHAIDAKIAQPMMTLPPFMMPALPFLDTISSMLSGAPKSLTPELAGMLKGRLWNVSNEKIRREIGWSPEISIKQSLSDTISALRASSALSDRKASPK
jgi:dihydroflavonol-4-reductase